MALFAVVHCRFVLHMAQRAVAVVRSGVRVGLKLFSLLGHSCFRMALDTGIFIRVLRIFHIGAVAHLARNTAGDMAVRARTFPLR